MSDLSAALFVVILLPFLGTTLGAGTVFLFKDAMNPALRKSMLGFASGVMIAASVWSLLIPAIEMAESQGVVGWLPAAAGFLLGMAFLLLLDTFVPHMHIDCGDPEGLQCRASKSTMLMLAVTLHNLPEGMAVGVVLAGAISGEMGLSFASAFALAAGIALQNFPEGAVISMPLVGQGKSRRRAFAMGTLSGAVEPLGAVLTICLTSLITPILPYILAFAAGAMVYVVVEELIPESQSGSHSNLGTIGAALGFALMMILDVALG